jgi:hypothetical protein
MKEIVNLNSAEKDELTGLPGIGSAMADRIIANRPYQDVKDLLNVNGVGPALFDRLISRISIAEAVEQEDEGDIIYLGTETTSDEPAEELKTETIQEPVSEDDLPSWEGSDIEETEVIGGDKLAEQRRRISTGSEKTEPAIPKEKAIVPVSESEAQKGTEGKKTKHITLSNALLLTAVFSFISFLLAVLLSLGILGSLNDGLRYATPDQIQVVVRKFELMNSEFELMSEDMHGLRTRLENLESLSGRVGEIEAETTQVSNDIKALAEEYQGITDQVADIVDTAERFQVFLTGLGNLLNNLTEGQ